MTPQELKLSILQLAIQGKLVEQRPEEGTGEELFKQIQAEKQALIKAGKLKKEKPLPEITEDEIPFDIPESWKWYRIGELFNIVNGFTPLKSNPEFWTDGDIPWFTIDDVHRQGRFISSTEKFITKKALSKNTERIVPADTVLLCCTASVGEYAYTKIPLTTNQQFNAFVVKNHYKNAVYPLYVFEYAKTLKGSLIGRAGKTTFNFVSVGKLSNMLIPLPPLAEQKRIVAKIEELLPLIDRYEQAWSKLEDFNKRFPVDMQKSILQMAIQGKLVPQLPEEGTGEELLKILYDEKNKIIQSGVLKGRKTKPLQRVPVNDVPFEIPDTWCWIRLGSVAEIFGRIGFRGYTKNDIVPVGKGAITISPSNIRPNGKTDFSDCTYLSWEKYEESPEIKVFEGDILLVKTGSSYGKCGIVSDLPEKATINPQLAILKYITCDVKYLDYVLKSPMARSQFESFVIGTSIPTFSQEKLANLLIPLPPLSEQKRIVAKLEEILPLCERLK